MNYPLLDSVNDPASLRQLSQAQLVTLAHEMREFILESVSKTGGHLSSNLGAVELAIALHYVYNTPFDRLIWDVGHQSYPHKILTGRREAMSHLRMMGGISGFPRRDESPFDAFGTGHSSTSISAALGMAIAVQRKKENRKVVAIIGDGAMSAGEAFEGLNNAGILDSDILVILNDNEMSISKPVGALNNILSRLLTDSLFIGARNAGKCLLKAAPQAVYSLAKRAEERVKGMMAPTSLFEDLGFNYTGPIDGHDLNVLIPTLKNIRQLKGPQFLHIITCKGYGYKLAEHEPTRYHGVPTFDLSCGIVPKISLETPTYTQVFGQWLLDMAKQDNKLIAITPAMSEGSGMVQFAETYPDRFFDVGIAEQHAVTFAAGLACEGFKPVVAIYSTFLQRAYDQLIHDVALQNLPVVFAIDRAGVVGPDGATHCGGFDISFLRAVPSILIMTPSDENECRQLLYTAYQANVPAAVRYPRETGVGVQIEEKMTVISLGQSVVRREGKDVAILAFGPLLHAALVVAEELNATVIDMRFVRPLDEAQLSNLVKTHTHLVTLEENVINGGAGSAVLEWAAANEVNIPILNLGLPERFLPHGDRASVLSEAGLDVPCILHSIKEFMSINHANDKLVKS